MIDNKELVIKSVCVYPQNAKRAPNFIINTSLQAKSLPELAQMAIPVVGQAIKSIKEFEEKDCVDGIVNICVGMLNTIEKDGVRYESRKDYSFLEFTIVNGDIEKLNYRF